MADVMHVKDQTTGEIHKLDPALNTMHLTSRDGVRLTFHPVTLRTLVPKGSEFSAISVLGYRPMRRL